VDFAGCDVSEVVTIGDATLYLGDCMEVLPTLGRFDAVITDPPYGIGGDTHAGPASSNWTQWGPSVWDKERPARAIFDGMREISSLQIIWGGNYFSDYLPPSQQWLSWDKGQDGFSLADFELAWSSQDKACRRINYARSLALKDGKQHPTQKPLAVMVWCIQQSGNPQTILDPFMGSGTTGVACVQLGRKFTGIERERKYFDIACERISRAQAQGQMFPPEQVKQVQETFL
jgi:DNA modification methylase